ncbi:transcriptional regulator, TetR family [Hyphomonas neptunium ATCC 15444]|uniref:Transcriptional regulator, TetR family n=2 Tax=Hyphomonas TaxID=85 RepID=Q0C4G3_HYPNA|nr:MULTISPECIES: TetR/AcrR family transcriptional regulator [Hyphomonas]ABI76699.1 transcriptional regulator, TetR family [Hyphomonas neptunium ATCC 15444]KCZ96408.1 TetR family transcriptional regulator [Hyphomonas hirschiana VP5]
MPKRTKEQAAETRESLLSAARESFANQGFAATSVATVAAAAGTTKGALFHYFSSKEALFLEVWTALQLEMDAAAREAAKAARSGTDPYAAFLAGCRVYLEWATRPDYQTIVLVDGPSVLGMARWHELDFQLGMNNMTQGAAYLARQGLLAEDRVRPAAVLLQAALNGAGFALSSSYRDVTVNELFTTFEQILRGLR